MVMDPYNTSSVSAFNDPLGIVDRIGAAQQNTERLSKLVEPGKEKSMSTGLAIASILAQIGTSVYNTYANRRENELARQFASAEAQKSFDRENEYNLPSHIVQRLAAAGISPQLLGGDMPSSSGASASSPGMLDAGVAQSPFNNLDMEDLLIQSQVNLNDARAARERGETSLVPKRLEQHGHRSD